MPYEVELSYNKASSTLSLPIRVREKHLTEGTRDAAIQPIGRTLQIAIWSERDNVIIRIPLTCWRTGKEESRRLSGANNGLISLGKFEDDLDVEDGTIIATIITHEITRQ